MASSRQASITQHTIRTLKFAVLLGAKLKRVFDFQYILRTPFAELDHIFVYFVNAFLILFKTFFACKIYPHYPLSVDLLYLLIAPKMTTETTNRQM